MDSHVCKYCPQDRNAHTSSGDTILQFTSGRCYEVPDMIVHYVEDHSYKPPDDFILDVTYDNIASVSYSPAKGIAVVKVGYLSGDFPKGETDARFKTSLRQLLQLAQTQGRRSQTRGI